MKARLNPIRLLSNGKTLVAACGVWATAGILASFGQQFAPPAATVLYGVCGVAGAVSMLSAFMLWARDLGRDDYRDEIRPSVQEVEDGLHATREAIWKIRLGLIGAYRCGDEQCRVERRALEDDVIEVHRQASKVDKVRLP